MLKSYFAALAATVAADLLWLGVVMGKFYRSGLGALARQDADGLKPVWWAAGVVYILIPLGVLLFVLPRSTSSGTAALYGAAFGLVLYGVYEGTNYALLAGWPLKLVVVDTLWGAALGAFVASAAWWASKAA